MRSTPRQMEGPYYPEADRDRDNDLTTLGPGKPSALGDVIHFVGTIRDGAGDPVAGARVELWQANAFGRYNHSQDPSGEPLDPHFQYWGRDVTGKDGRFRFKTVVPGRYLDGADYRPPHLHVKVTAPDFYHLTTQIYFDSRSFADSRVAWEVASSAESVGYRRFG